jgi:hypothetical protein
MAGAQLVLLSGPAQLLPGELTDRLQHPIAARRRLVDEQRLVDQGGHQQQDIQVVAGTGPDLLGRLQRAAAGEHGQPPQQDLLGLRQEPVTPLDGRPQGLVMRQRGPRPAGQEPEPIAETVAQLLGGERAGTGCGQLDRQRDPVQTPADAGHRGRVLRCQREGRIHQPGPVDEQPHGLGAVDRCRVQRLHGQRRDAVRQLPGHAERLP